MQKKVGSEVRLGVELGWPEPRRCGLLKENCAWSLTLGRVELSWAQESWVGPSGSLQCSEACLGLVSRPQDDLCSWYLDFSDDHPNNRETGYSNVLAWDCANNVHTAVPHRHDGGDGDDVGGDGDGEGDGNTDGDCEAWQGATKVRCAAAGHSLHCRGRFTTFHYILNYTLHVQHYPHCRDRFTTLYYILNYTLHVQHYKHCRDRFTIF